MYLKADTFKKQSVWICNICIFILISCLLKTEAFSSDHNLPPSANQVQTACVTDQNKMAHTSSNIADNKPINAASFYSVEDNTSSTFNEENYKKEIAQLKQEMQEKMTYQIQCNEKAISSVNTIISGASVAIQILTVVIAILGVALATYITFVEKKVQTLTNYSKSSVEENRTIEQTVKKLHFEIINNIEKLYNDLKKQETKSLVNRLVQVPEDIDNLFSILAAREMSPELFTDLKTAYISIKKDRQNGFNYLILFFQHFPQIAMFDEDLAEEIESAYHNLMNSAFRNDILKTSRDFIYTCAQKGLLNYKERLNTYYKALSNSKHKDYSDMHIEIYKALPTKEEKFNLYDIIQSDSNLKDVASIYGKQLLDEYQDSSGNTESQKLVLQQITEENQKIPNFKNNKTM